MGKRFNSRKYLVLYLAAIICICLNGFSQSKLSPAAEKEVAQEAPDLESPQEESPLLKQAEFVISQINAQINDKGKDILVLAKGIKNFGKGGRASWASNIIYFAREFEHYQVIKIVNNRGIEELKVVDAHQVKTYNDESGKKYFNEAMKLNPGDIYVSSLLTSNITNNKVIQLATPLVDLSTMDKGILLFEWLPESLFELAANLKVENNGYILIIDTEGNYIYHPDKNKILDDNINKNASESLREVAKLMLAFESDVTEFTIGENRFQVAFAPYSQMGWAVAVVKPLNAAIPQMPQIPESATAALSPTLSAQPALPAVIPPESAVAAKSVEAVVAPTKTETAAPKKDLAPITPATRKVLDGSLRNQKINSLRVVTRLTVTSPEGIKYQLKVRQAANLAKESEYQKLLDKNKSTLITYNDFDERYFNHTKFEVISPAFLQETTVTRYNEALIVKPIENSAVTINTNKIKEYQRLTNDEMVNLPRQFASLDFDRFGNDTFDIKIIDGIPAYVLTLELKQNITTKGLTFDKLRIFIQGDYFMPVRLEWFNPAGENNLTITYEDMLINGFFSEKHFNVTPPQGVSVIPYSKLKPTLIADAKKREQELGGSFSGAEVRKILIDALKERGLTIARGLEAACKRFIENGNVVQLQESVHWAQEEAQISYVMIVDNQGETVITSKNQPSQAESTTNLEVKHQIKENNKILGVIRVGLSKEEVEKTLEKTAQATQVSPTVSEKP